MGRAEAYKRRGVISLLHISSVTLLGDVNDKYVAIDIFRCLKKYRITVDDSFEEPQSSDGQVK